MPPALIPPHADPPGDTPANPPAGPPPATPLDGRLKADFASAVPGMAVAWKPRPSPAAQWLFLNRPLARDLGLDADALGSPAGLAVLAGNAVPAGAQPVAQAYSGHQFGGFSPQLGDGRALLLGELDTPQRGLVDIAFKGSGRTPFSRGGDGKAAVGPMLREAIISEAMHHLGIPTTRALAVVATGERVVREGPLPGALLTRVAASHLRVGSFQFVAVRDDLEGLKRLLAHAIDRHDPGLNGLSSSHTLADRALAFLDGVAGRQARLIAQWMHAGFVHGVMNTDNMTISGETIDYGPCAFMDAHDPATVFSSIDHHGRYAYGNQPAIAQWNLARLAETLLPLMADTWGDDEAVQRATAAVHAFDPKYRAAWLAGARAKLGLPETSGDEAEADFALAEAWLQLLTDHQVDHTLAWRYLADAAEGQDAPLESLFDAPTALRNWLARWRDTLAAAAPAAGALDGHTRAARMRRVSPAVIPRNYRVEEALQAASQQGDLAPMHRLNAILAHPYDCTPEEASYLSPPAREASRGYHTFCGT